MNALVLHQLLLAVGPRAITNTLPAQRLTTTAFMERKCLGTLFYKPYIGFILFLQHICIPKPWFGTMSDCVWLFIVCITLFHHP